MKCEWEKESDEKGESIVAVDLFIAIGCFGELPSFSEFLLILILIENIAKLSMIYFGQTRRVSESCWT